MLKFGTKDIVKVKKLKGKYFIITHYVDLFLDDTEKITGYRLVKVFPVSNEVESIIVLPDDVSIVAKYTEPEKSDEYKMLENYLNEEYKRIGFDSFEQFVEMATSSSNVANSEIAVKQGQTRKKNNNILIEGEEKIVISEPVTNEVDYSDFDDYNEGLDWLNWLKRLKEEYRVLDDKEYSERCEIVINRLKQLTETKQG